MKYLRKFETEADVLMWDKPNVTLVGDTGSILYNADSSGVYIQHIDGTLYTTDAWTAGGFTGDLANGVAVIDAACQFVVAKELVSTSYVTWLPMSDVPGVMTETDSSIAATDYAGVENTAAILAVYEQPYGAAYYCANYTFPNGQKGYLPALGELLVCEKYSADVKDALELIEATDWNHDLRSSTEYNAKSAWTLNVWGSAEVEDKAPAGGGYTYARAFTTLEL